MEMAKGQNQPEISAKRIKHEEFMEEEEEEEGGEDRISVLPDCLLAEILSHLPTTKDAIKTGTLSKRWEHLWTLIPVLNFEHKRDNQPLSEFVSFVDKTLTQCRQLKLNRFELFTSYDTEFESQFKNWIRYAISCNVEVLEIYIMNCRAAQLFDQIFFTSSCFTELRLSHCLLNPIGAISWKNLRSLRIDHAKLDEDMIENILSGSPLLETLEMDSCYGFTLLDITSKSVKNLMFYRYLDPQEASDDGSRIIEINAPNILSLAIEGVLFHTLLLINVSSLVEVNLDYMYANLFHYETTPGEAEEEMLKGFILKLRHVKDLKTGDFCSEVLSRLQAKGFILPPNVKFPADYS